MKETVTREGILAFVCSRKKKSCHPAIFRDSVFVLVSVRGIKSVLCDLKFCVFVCVRVCARVCLCVCAVFSFFVLFWNYIITSCQYTIA